MWVYILEVREITGKQKALCPLDSHCLLRLELIDTIRQAANILGVTDSLCCILECLQSGMYMGLGIHHFFSNASTDAKR